MAQPGNRQPGQLDTAKVAAVTVRALSHDKPIATIPDLNLSAADENRIKHDLTFDKRIHLIPEARLIITIPATNDRLVLYRFSG
jgi:hypothetical protein